MDGRMEGQKKGQMEPTKTIYLFGSTKKNCFTTDKKVQKKCFGYRLDLPCLEHWILGEPISHEDLFDTEHVLLFKFSSIPWI